MLKRSSVTTLSIRIALLMLGCVPLSGCKNREGGLFSGRDPLIGGEKIPPQGLPTQGNAARDPLLKGSTASRDAREPYRPSAEITSAALAGMRPQDDVDPLRMDERRPTGTKLANPVSPTLSVGNSTEQMMDDLRRIGARVYAPIKLQSGDYEFRAALPRNESGAMTTFTGIAPTANAAIRDVIEQVRAESKR